MTLTAFGIIPMEVIRAERVRDAYGQDVPNWVPAEPARWDNGTAWNDGMAWNEDGSPGAVVFKTSGWFQPSGGASTGGGTESLIDRDEQRYDGLAWLPAGTPINGRDRLRVGAETYEVIGPPARRLSPWSTAEHHVRVTLRRVTGPAEMSTHVDRNGGPDGAH